MIPTLLSSLFLSMIMMACIVSESNQAIDTLKQCGQHDSSLTEELMEILRQVQQQLGPPGCNLPQNRSCQEILYCFLSAPSGYYWMHAPSGQLVQVYCDMEGINCEGQGGWTIGWPMLTCHSLVPLAIALRV